MGRALGASFEVRNFGVQGTTAIQSTGSSYAATPQMKDALAYNPDIVLFWFGGNDSFQGTWDAHKAEFRPDYTSLVRAFQALPSHPKTFLVRLWVFVDMPVQRTVIDREILPIIDQIAVDTNSTLIDYRKAFEMHPEYFPDGMHPNDTGTLAIGKLFADVVTMTLAAGADGGVSLDAGASMDAAARPDGAAGRETGDDAAPAVDANDEPASPGAGGAPGGGGGSSGGGTGGAFGGAGPSAGAGNMQALGGGANAEGCACRMRQREGRGSTGALLVMLVGVGRIRRRRRASRSNRQP